jgi:ADP-ribosylglycohydrolase
MMLGLALGDTVGAARGALPAAGPLRAGVSTQLACFTAEGIIRAQVRGNHKGICHPPTVILHAYCRWAFLQGIETEKMWNRWGPHTDSWPDGWLVRVPALGERRGSAPATVAALSRIDKGDERMATSSRGHHALTRGLPIAVTGLLGITEADAVAALTHGDKAGRSATVHAAVLAHCCLTASDSQSGNPVRDALQSGISALAPRGRIAADHTTNPLVSTEEEHGRLAAAFRYAVDEPANASRLAQLAPDPTAPSALLGGLYVAASFPDRAALPTALDFAAKAPDGESVACVAGALLGAVHGGEALPVALVSRHELAWVLDTLARDLVLELDDTPSGDGFGGGWDPHWWERYRGW